MRTTIRAVAVQAGVAEATVYLAFPNKAALLDAVILRAVRDNASEPLDVIAVLPAAEILPRFAESNAALMARAAHLIALGEASTSMDAALRPMRERAHERLRTAFAVIADQLDEAGTLRVERAAAAATLYALANEATYLRMTEGTGLPPEHYAGWLADTLAAVLLR